jgi:hypothetical protein
VDELRRVPVKVCRDEDAAEAGCHGKIRDHCDAKGGEREPA